MTSVAVQMKRFPLRPTYFQELRIPGAKRLLSWIGLGVLGSGSASLLFFHWHATALIGTFAVLGACIAIVPLTMKAIYLVLLNWATNVPSFLKTTSPANSDWYDWFKQQFDNFSSSSAIAYFGIVYTVFSIIAFSLGGAFAKLPVFVILVCGATAAIASFVCGVGLASVLYLALVVWRLGNRYSVRVSEHGYGVLSTGKMLVKCYALVAIVWCLYTSSASWGLRGKWIPLLALALPAVIFFVGSFIVCQFPLRKRMIEYKRSALLDFDDLLERLTPTDPSDITDERQRQINFCLSEMKRIRSLPEWPFSFGNLSSVMGVSLGAVAPQIIHLIPVIMPLFGKLKKLWA